jgi:hypothetical protein
VHANPYEKWPFREGHASTLDPDSGPRSAKR